MRGARSQPPRGAARPPRASSGPTAHATARPSPPGPPAARHVQLTHATYQHENNDTKKKTQRVVRVAPRGLGRRQARQQRLHPVGVGAGARAVARGAAAPVQPQDAAQAAAGDGVAAAVQRGAGAGRPHRRRHRRPHRHPAVAGLLQHRGPAAAARPLRLLPRVLRVHSAGRVPRRARRAYRHRFPAHLAGVRRRPREGGADDAARGSRRAADGRPRARLPHQLRLRPGLLGVHLRRRAHDSHLSGEGPLRHIGVRDHLPATVDLHIPKPARRLALGPRARLRLHRAPALHEESGHGETGREGGGRAQHAAAARHQVPVDGGHLPERDRGGRQRRTRLLVRGAARRRPLPAHGGERSHRFDPVRRAGAAAAAVQLRARRQHDRRLPRDGVRAGLRAHRDPADSAARGYRHMQGLLRRPDHRRDAGDDRARRRRRRQLLRGRVPRGRVARALRRLQRLRREDPPQRPLHGADGAARAAVLHLVLRVHPEGGARGRHHLRDPLHGRVQRRQADVARQEAGPRARRRHLPAVPRAAHRAGHPHRRHRQHHLHTVPRGQAQVLRRDAEERGRRRVPDDNAGPVPDVPLGGLRAPAGDQVRRRRRGRAAAARGAGVHPHLQRGLHGRHLHRAADGRLPRAPPAALLLQREAFRLLHLRGGRQPGPLRRLLRGRGPRPAPGRGRPARPPASRQAAPLALALAPLAALADRPSRLTFPGVITPYLVIVTLRIYTVCMYEEGGALRPGRPPRPGRRATRRQTSRRARAPSPRLGLKHHK